MPATRHGFLSGISAGSLNPYGPCTKVILLPFFPDLACFFRHSSESVGLHQIDWLTLSSLTVPGWYEGPQRYLHPALPWNLIDRRGFGVLLKASHSIEVATQKMNNLTSSTGLQRGISSQLPVRPDVFRELNFAANCSAQRRGCMIIAVSCELPADFPQFVVFPSTVTSPPS